MFENLEKILNKCQEVLEKQNEVVILQEKKIETINYVLSELIDLDFEKFKNATTEASKHLNNKYFLTYISGALQGKLNTVEISKEDYLLAKEKRTGLDELCIKYNVF